MKSRASSIALYRKYRPVSFKEVIGQEHITSVLDGAISLGNISHAYLFSGSRGTGKTSVARIFAKSIKTTPNDIYEIDAASYTGVDNIREINEGVNVLPFESPYKVYIIDEVHMLSKAAFNALLKTLEEPPSHVIFILATTELEKLPETVISRCQTFNFRKPSLALLKSMISAIAKREGYSLEPASADLIALLGDGSFRDTQGILEKVISSSKDKRITRAEVERVTAAPPGELVNQYIKAFSPGAIDQGLMALGEALASNVDMKVFTKLLLEKVRAIILLRLAPASLVELGETFSSTDAAFIKDMSETNKLINSETLVELLSAYERIGYAAIPTIPLEIALIKLSSEKD
jgi:DNA polymerase-3 subunit gamma/tau